MSALEAIALANHLAVSNTLAGILAGHADPLLGSLGRLEHNARVGVVVEAVRVPRVGVL